MDDEKLKILSFTAPKNFKSGRLIMGRFRWIDLLILIAGSTFSFLGEIVYVAVSYTHLTLPTTSRV